MDDEKIIKQLLENWARSISAGENDKVLKNHSKSAVIYDVLPPMKYEGTESYRKSWDEWQPETQVESLFDLHDLKIVSDQNVAFAHAFIHCGGALPDGKNFEDWVRATFCLEKQDDKWLITHQHISMPRT